MWAALQGFGYTEREAQFIELAALHSGYFLRRQFNTFLGRSRGRAADDFIQKLFRREHVTCDVFLRHAHVYHLSAKPLYTLLGEPDNRHRRSRSPIGIKSKLMTLDFVLAHRDVQFLATERARVTYFAERGVELEQLPHLVYRAHKGGDTTARYFVEKFPLSVLDDGSVGLSYIDPGEYSVEGFETFLDRYTKLIDSLPHVRITYVADTSRNFADAATRLDSWRGTSEAVHDVPTYPGTVDRMMRFFADLRLVETN